MGGHAFNNHYTPRMPPIVYKYLREKLHAILGQFFELVGTPVEGPGKSDFGDVDVLVCGILGDKVDPMEFGDGNDTRESDTENWKLEVELRRKEMDNKVERERRLVDTVGQWRWDAIYEEFGAVAVINGGAGPGGKSFGRSYCVPWPKDEDLRYWAESHGEKQEDASSEDGYWAPRDRGVVEELEEVSLTDDKVSSEPKLEQPDEPKFIQVDLTILRTETDYNWQLFHHAHGDLWNILGTIIRPFGLTINDSGMHLRIPAIEKIDKKKACIPLTSDPTSILSFLGLEYEGWDTPFESAWDMFYYAAECKMFCVQAEDEGLLEYSKDKANGLQNDIYDLSDDSKDKVEKVKKTLKHSDRRRLTQRPLFNKWITEFLPHARKDPKYYRSVPTRDIVRNAAFYAFGADVKTAYDETEFAFEMQRHRDMVFKEHVKANIPDVITDPIWKSFLTKEMKKCVMDGEMCEGVVMREPLRDEKGWYNTAAVDRFVSENWQQIGDVAWRDAEIKKVIGMEKKREAKKERIEGEKRREGADKLKEGFEKFAESGGLASEEEEHP